MYTAPNPSCRTVLTMQSSVPVYGKLPLASGFMLMRRDLARSMGLLVRRRRCRR